MPDQLTGQPAVYPIRSELLPAGEITEGRYVVRFARSERELDELLVLRYEVFNLELGEGLETSHATGRDRDALDAVCHHLVVSERVSGRVVGTYRLQTSAMAAAHLGFYSDAEFDLSMLPAAVLDDAVELGRACIALEHRNTQVLFLLWQGLARYVAATGQRYLFGCCSLTSQDPAEGWAVMELLAARGQVHPELRVAPRPGFACEHGGRFAGQVKIPKLFRIYLRYGALVCSPPVIDRQFKTIDYLVIFDVTALDEKRFRMFFG
jgi:putative hemolysin